MRLGPVLALVVGCTPAEPAPPIVMLEDGLDSSFVVHADAEHLIIAHRGTTGVSGLFRVSLADPTQRELLAPGIVQDVRVGDGAVVALQGSRLVTIPLDGSAITEAAVADSTIATASSGGITYALENHPDAPLRTRIVTLATESEPSRVVLETSESLDSTRLLTDDTYLYWFSGGANHLRVARDGSESEPTYLWEGGDWDALEVEGSREQEQDWMLGVVDGDFFALRNYTSFFATGGEWSNGDPKGHEAFGGGALYTVGLDTEANPTVSPDARLVRGDFRVAAFQATELLAQVRGGDLVTLDTATGETTTLARTPHDLTGSTHLVRNDTAIFYEYFDPDQQTQAIYRVDLVE